VSKPFVDSRDFIGHRAVHVLEVKLDRLGKSLGSYPSAEEDLNAAGPVARRRFDRSARDHGARPHRRVADALNERPEFGRCLARSRPIEKALGNVVGEMTVWPVDEHALDAEAATGDFAPRRRQNGEFDNGSEIRRFRAETMPFSAKIRRRWRACRLEVKPAKEFLRLLLGKTSMAKRLTRFELVFSAVSGGRQVWALSRENISPMNLRLGRLVFNRRCPSRAPKTATPKAAPV
jgi:hypothetical protein